MLRQAQEQGWLLPLCPNPNQEHSAAFPSAAQQEETACLPACLPAASGKTGGGIAFPVAFAAGMRLQEKPPARSTSQATTGPEVSPVPLGWGGQRTEAFLDLFQPQH